MNNRARYRTIESSFPRSAWKRTPPTLCVLLCVTYLLVSTRGQSLRADEFIVTSKPIAWQQVEPKLTFHFFIERELYTTLDRVGRMVLAAESERAGQKLPDLSVRWTINQDGKVVARGSASIAQGGVDVTFPLAQLKPGNYDVAAQLLGKAETVLAEKSAVLRYEQRASPAQSGQVGLQLPRGMPLKAQTWPVHAGVPFPKGALWDAKNVRVLDAAGREVDADVIVRGRWGNGEQSSIRWVGVEFQPGPAESSWPDGKAPYNIEFGPKIARHAPRAAIHATVNADGIQIETGTAKFEIRRKGFNVIDRWTISGSRESAFQSSPQNGLYVVDHEGTIYRAANDADVDLKIEEQSAMHVVVRAAGWYVKDDAADPPTQNLVLPTDKLCRFVTRIEAYAGKPYVRVENSLIVTFDTFKVQLRDAGMSIPMPKDQVVARAMFGIEGRESLKTKVPSSGVRGVQHLHNAFTIEDGAGKSLAEAAHSAGWVIAAGNRASLALSLRDTWQRYPKELEVLPDALKLHVWPAHGREHPQINQVARNQIHRLLFAHQGTQLNLATPWDYCLAACTSYGEDNAPGVGHVRAAVNSSALGVATTSDVLLEIGTMDDEPRMVGTASCFQIAPHAVADPKWTCASLALGYINPYDAQTFPALEEMIQNDMRGYWKYQDMGEMFGMWIYRSWHHSEYKGNGAWELHRLFNASHHHEAIIPWMLYARSADPFYLTQGMANIRQFTDVQMVHHADPRYTHRGDSNQNQIVGATKHVSFVPWGWDHLLMGHQVCYEAPITAYYLTGDLRLREVVVDEWLNTLLADRLNPEYSKADLSNSTDPPETPRNNSTSISEIIDAYQLTYDPRLLVYLAPRYDIWANVPGRMGTDWGQSMHHELLFRGSAQASEQLLGGVKAYQARDYSTDKVIARSMIAPQEMFALAGIVEPQQPWALRAFNIASYEYLQTYAWNRISAKNNDVFCNTGEFVLFLPRMMYALEHSSRSDVASVIGRAQTSARDPGAPTRVVVREDVDQDFKIYVNGDVKQKDGFDVQVFNPDGALAARQHVGTGYQTFEMTVPRDGKTGEYVIFVGTLQNDKVFAPFTALPEVYVLGNWTGNNDSQRYFTRSPGAEPVSLTVKPQSAPSTVLARDQQTEIANSEKGEEMKISLGPEGVWVWNRACYIATRRENDEPAILAIQPERWFMPGEKSLKVQAVKHEAASGTRANIR